MGNISCSDLQKKIYNTYKKGYMCCSENCSRGRVQKIPLSCVDWQLNYSGHLFCADIVKDEQLKIDLSD